MKTIHTPDGQRVEIQVNHNVMSQNIQLAKQNLDTLNRHHIHAIDILGSIGSGKTSTIQQLVRQLSQKKKIAAIAGDLTTTIDADRIREKGAHVLQINTDGGCHLDAHQVKSAYDMLNLKDLDLIFVENVGNLICPGSWLVGAHQRMVVVSVTEGPYMIVKHPYILQDASVLAINKIDLAQAMEVDIHQLKKDALNIKPDLNIVFINARTGQGIPELIDALKLAE